jgi:hypothetical protein
MRPLGESDEQIEFSGGKRDQNTVRILEVAFSDIDRPAIE